MVIASTALWAQVLADQRVNAPLQRFKRHLLLLLQLAILSALVLAAMQPLWRATQPTASGLPILIDCSASMAARDPASGMQRLAIAQRLAHDLIDGLAAGREICLIAFSRRARQLCGFTSDKRRLRQALTALTVDDEAGQLDEVIQLTAALHRAQRFDEALLISDGNIPAAIGSELAFKLKYQLIAAALPNTGVTALAARRATNGDWDLLVELAGSAVLAARGSLVVEHGEGQTLATTRIELSQPDCRQQLSFRLPARLSGWIHVRLMLEGPDTLATDDHAALELPQLRPLAVYVAPTLTSYRDAVAALHSEHIALENEAASHDLVISDQAADLNRSALLHITTGVIPPDITQLVERYDHAGEFVDWDRFHPLLEHVQLAEILLAEDVRWRDRNHDSALEHAGYRPLIFGRAGPLAVYREALTTAAPSAHLALLFHTDRTTLPYRVGFPVLVANALAWAQRRAGLAETTALAVGELAQFDGVPNEHYHLLGPGSQERRVCDPDGVVRGFRMPRAGRYQLLAAGVIQRTLHANLLSRQETRLQRNESLTFRESLQVAATTRALVNDRPAWPLLVWVALALLCVEWWIFHVGPRLTT
jgi:hypothetical protein